MTSSRLFPVPITLRAANTWIAALHRHHGPVRGAKFCLAIADEQGTIHGVIAVGRPVARALDDGLTAEANRSATDGFPNANSALYGAAWRVCQAMGYRRLVTYNQEDESGVSLTAAGFTKVATLKPRKGWADSSVALKALRSAEGSGGVGRARWQRETA